MSQPRSGVLVDLGLQAERTCLAWRRTGLAFAAVAALLVHGATSGAMWPMVLAAPAGAAAALLLSCANWRYRATLARVRQGRSPAAAHLVRSVSIATCVVSVAGLTTVLTRG